MLDKKKAYHEHSSAQYMAGNIRPEANSIYFLHLVIIDRFNLLKALLEIVSGEQHTVTAAAVL